MKIIMKDDILYVQMRAESDNGDVGDAMVPFTKKDPDYEKYYQLYLENVRKFGQHSG